VHRAAYGSVYRGAKKEKGIFNMNASPPFFCTLSSSTMIHNNSDSPSINQEDRSNTATQPSMKAIGIFGEENTFAIIQECIPTDTDPHYQRSTTIHAWIFS